MLRCRFDVETVALTKKQGAELELTELKMLTFSLGVTRMDRVTIKYIRGIAPAEWLGNKVLYMHSLIRFICKCNPKCLRDLAEKNR